VPARPLPLAATWSVVKEVLADVMAVPEGERSAFLAQHCPDPNVLEAVVSLMGYAPAASSWPPPIALQEDELPTGTKLGTYLIVDTLGRGGMGCVYLAKDLTLHRKVAIKSVLAAGQNNVEQRTRMLREATAAAQTNHANIAAIHGFFENDGRAFIVMEYVEGHNLAAIFQGERLSSDRVIAIGRQCIAGVAAAHAKGVVHRDLKPANIRINEDGVVKILDFGIAGLTEAFTTVPAAMADIDHTRPGQWGTPGYMSPEQLLTKKFDARSDIFSLGVVLFELATGRRAYEFTDFLGLVQAMGKPLPRADAVDRRVPPGLADVIATATSIEPADRFPTARAFGEALQALAGSDQKPAKRVSPVWLRRLAMAPIAIVPLAGLGYLTCFAVDFSLEQRGYVERGISEWLRWGVKFSVPILFMMLVVLVLVALGITVRTVLGPQSARLKKIEGTVRSIATRADRRFRLSDLTVRASWLLLGCTVALVAGWLAFSWYIPIFFTKVSAATASQLALLERPANEFRVHQEIYQLTFTVLAVFAGVTWTILGRALLRAGGLSNRMLLAGGAVVTLLTLATLAIPYRLLLEDSFRDKVTWEGQTCYSLVTNPDRTLLFCPSATPRVFPVPAGTPLKPTGVKESIFTTFAAAPRHP